MRAASQINVEMEWYLGWTEAMLGCLIETHFSSSSYPDLKNLVVAAQYRYVQINLALGAYPKPIKPHPLAFFFLCIPECIYL